MSLYVLNIRWVLLSYFTGNARCITWTQTCAPFPFPESRSSTVTVQCHNHHSHKIRDQNCPWVQNVRRFAPEYNEYAGSELTDLPRACSFGTDVLAAAVTGCHLGHLMEQISFCAQKEAVFAPFTWNWDRWGCIYSLGKIMAYLIKFLDDWCIFSLSADAEIRLLNEAWTECCRSVRARNCDCAWCWPPAYNLFSILQIKECSC